MQIAIIGAGFSGLASAWNLLENKAFSNFKVTIFDSLAIGEGTSGISAGLLHPYAGAHSKLNRMGLEGMKESMLLLDVASKALGQPVADYAGLLRIAITNEQTADYQKSVNLFNEISWWDVQKCLSSVDELAHYPGIFIKSSITVFSKMYLQGLWLDCQQKGAIFNRSDIENLEELNNFDVVIIAAGAKTNNLLSSQNLPLHTTKGQILEYNWPENRTPLPFSVNSQAYIVMDHNKRKCLVGSTYEREFTNHHPYVKFAIEDIMPKAIAIYPALRDFEVSNCFAGMRASTPNHLPLIQQINPKTWVITGMGSKGLLYHALYGKLLVNKIVEEYPR